MSTNISEEAISCMLRAEEACNLKMEAAGSSEKTVPMYQETRRYKLEDRSLNAALETSKSDLLERSLVFSVFALRRRKQVGFRDFCIYSSASPTVKLLPSKFPDIHKRGVYCT